MSLCVLGCLKIKIFFGGFMNTLKKIVAFILMATLLVCTMVAFASCGAGNGATEEKPGEITTALKIASAEQRKAARKKKSPSIVPPIASADLILLSQLHISL